MMRKPPLSRMLAWLALLGVTLLVAGFFRAFDRVPYQHWVGYRGEALRNDLLALERLLAGMGADVQSHASLRDLPPPGATMLLPTERVSLSSARTQALRAWVEAGGHLLVVIWTIGAEGGEDALLDPLGIEQVENELDNSKEWEKVYDETGHVATVTAFGEPLKVHFDPRFAFKEAPPSALLEVRDEYGLHALAMPLGKGRLTVLTDVDFLYNGSIGNNDHAAFAWHLFHVSGNRPQVWVVRGEDIPALATLTWQHGRAMVIAAAVLLAVLLWSRMGRFGPVLPAPPLARKRLGEHIVASGWFLWRQGLSEPLLTGVREAIIERVRVQRGSDAGGATGDQLAQMTRMPAPAVRRALAVQATREESEFIETVRILETVRKRL